MQQTADPDEDLLQDAMKSENVLVVDVLSAFSSKGVMRGYEVNLVRIVVNDDCDRLKALAGR